MSVENNNNNNNVAEVKGDEFWDYDQQVDMEAFSTKDFYSTLAKQTSDVTAALARQKDQVKRQQISTEESDIKETITNFIDTDTPSPLLDFVDKIFA